MKLTSKTFSKIILVMACAFTFATAQAQYVNNHKPGESIKEQIAKSGIHNSTREHIKDILDYAFQFQGVRYQRGASSPSGFDCSGFTSYVFKKFGYDLDRSSGEQINNGRRVGRDELRPGDLVFFNGRARGNRIGHVGIVTEVDGRSFKFIHAASTGIRESHSSESYYNARYMGACRVVE